MIVLYVWRTDIIVLFVYAEDLFCELAELRTGAVRMSYFPWSGLIVADLSGDKCLTVVMMRSRLLPYQLHGLLDLWFWCGSYARGESVPPFVGPRRVILVERMLQEIRQFFEGWSSWLALSSLGHSCGDNVF